MNVDFSKLDRAFNPRSIVVVGDKDELRWLRCQGEFKGNLYSVQVNPETIKRIEALGVKNYTSLLDVPDPIDLVIVAVSRALASRILDDCIRKKVAAVHFFTSGFSETATAEGIKEEKALAEKAKQAGMHLIGPNCVGIFNPGAGIKQGLDQYVGTGGAVGFISQSGDIAQVFSIKAHLEGVDIAKSVSFGNGIVLESTDFLEYFADDPSIKVIGMYLEGIKDGKRFLRVLKEVTRKKPVVIWKGGRTEEGNRAVASHTGSLALSKNIWDAAVKQCGAINAATEDELIDTLKAVIFLPPVRGNRVGIVGGSGGQSVVIADIFAEAGLKVPILTDETYEQFASFFKLVGASYRNPIDQGGTNRAEITRIIDILERDANVDNVVFLFSTRHFDAKQTDDIIESLVNLKARTAKPLMTIIEAYFSPQWVEQVGAIIQKLQSAGIPVYLNYRRGARALHNVWSLSR